MSDLDVLHTVTIKLQDNNLDMSDTRALFDAVISQFPSTSKYLSPNANIVDYPDFEKGIIKVLNKEIAALSPQEEKSVECFLRKKESEVPVQNIKIFAEDVLARKKRRLDFSASERYCSLHYICSTTNIVERLFSVCGNVLTDNRQRMLPINFELHIYLKVNRSFWNLALVAQILIK